MKVFTIVLKVLAALAAIAGIVYVIATYGDKIVAWFRKLLGGCPCFNCEGDCETCECDCDCECVEEDIAEIAEEAPVEETPVEEAAPVADEETVIASDADFEG